MSIVLTAALLAATTALPAAVTGDFDGDRRADSARFVRKGNLTQLEIRLAARPETVWRPVEAAGKEGNLYLQTLLPGRFLPPCADAVGDNCPAAIDITTDAIAFGTPEASMAIVWWTRKGFKTLWISD